MQYTGTTYIPPRQMSMEMGYMQPMQPIQPMGYQPAPIYAAPLPPQPVVQMQYSVQPVSQ